MELFIPAGITPREIQVLQQPMEQALASELPGLRKRTIPQVRG